MQWPPHLGVGRLHARRRIWVPLEQVTEQAAQGPQSDQPPISVEEKRRDKMEVVVLFRGPGFLMYPTSAYPIPSFCHTWPTIIAHLDYCSSLHTGPFALLLSTYSLSS